MDDFDSLWRKAVPDTADSELHVIADLAKYEAALSEAQKEINGAIAAVKCKKFYNLNAPAILASLLSEANDTRACATPGSSNTSHEKGRDKTNTKAEVEEESIYHVRMLGGSKGGGRKKHNKGKR